MQVFRFVIILLVFLVHMPSWLYSNDEEDTRYCETIDNCDLESHHLKDNNALTSNNVAILTGYFDNLKNGESLDSVSQEIIDLLDYKQQMGDEALASAVGSFLPMASDFFMFDLNTYVNRVTDYTYLARNNALGYNFAYIVDNSVITDQQYFDVNNSKDKMVLLSHNTIHNTIGLSLLSGNSYLSNDDNSYFYDDMALSVFLMHDFKTSMDHGTWSLLLSDNIAYYSNQRIDGLSKAMQFGVLLNELLLSGGWRNSYNIYDVAFEPFINYQVGYLYISNYEEKGESYVYAKEQEHTLLSTMNIILPFKKEFHILYGSLTPMFYIKFSYSAYPELDNQFTLLNTNELIDFKSNDYQGLLVSNLLNLSYVSDNFDNIVYNLYLLHEHHNYYSNVAIHLALQYDLT